MTGTETLHLYHIRYLTDTELTPEDITTLHSRWPMITVTNVTTHPWDLGEKRNWPIGYIDALFVADTPSEATTIIGDLICSVIGEGHLTELSVSQLGTLNAYGVTLTLYNQPLTDITLTLPSEEKPQ